MNRIVVEQVQITDYRIEILYKVEGKVKKHFNNSIHSFWCEYSSVISSVPIGVAIIPFVCNVLPLAWLTDAELILPELDKDFYLSISELKNGYKEMYPKVPLAGKVLAENVINYRQEKPDFRSAVFFSGGVDATASLLAHITEKPDLVTIWGADIKLDDKIGWNNVQTHIQNVAGEFGLMALTIKSNFRSFIKPVFGALSAYWHDNYWYGIQHGIGIIGHIAPYAYVRGLSMTYIGSTNSPEYRMEYACASDPRIDNHVRFAGMKVLHDQADCTRQDKIDHIVDYVSKKHVGLTLRVCWISTGGKNCCRCEKCFRTIMGLLASNAEPRKFGFDVILSDLISIKPYLERKVWLSDGDITFWKEIQQRFIENKACLPNRNELNWIYDYNFDKINCTFRKRMSQMYSKCRGIGSHIKHIFIGG